MKPAGNNIMEEFYKDHTNDPDTNGIRILDPFMGGGTTVVEALRLGCHVTGIDLNPVAWFIVKTEIEPVDIDQLKDAFKRLAERKTASGKSVKEELLSHYKTDCPCCGQEADIIYTFWVKSAICTNPTCKKQVPLFKDYIIAQKSPSTRYISDYQCPHCKKTFDLDVETASLIAQSSLTVENSLDSAGEQRGNKRWTVVDNFTGKAKCPWCNETLKTKNARDNKVKKSRKKVPLTVLLCPECYSVWQMRGTLPDEVICPLCSNTYNWSKSNVADKGKFVCSVCGIKDAVIKSIKKLPEDQLLPTKPYAIEGYCPNCAGDNNNHSADLYGQAIAQKGAIGHSCNIHKNNGKFFKKVEPADLKRYQDAEARWEAEKDSLPYPKSEIPDGQETHRLLEHHYKYWHQMFNLRQLLCLSTLLKTIDDEPDQTLKEMLLSAFYSTLESNNVFCRYTIEGGNKSQGIFSRHDFQPKLTFTENNPWGSSFGHSTFKSNFNKVVEGKMYCNKPYDRRAVNGEYVFEERKEAIEGDCRAVLCQDSRNAQINSVAYIITDPPYSGNVNYSELADFFYVWLRLLLSRSYPHFSPEISPKAEEIIENPVRGKSLEDFRHGLTDVWRKCHDHLDKDGLVVFTFHHAEGSTWEVLLESLCDASFVVEAIYPIHGEAESSLHLQDKQAISYDLIHVCRKRTEENGKKRSWAGVRQEIRRKAREEIKLIESGRYGEGQLSAADINIILIGKCLELYSKHYGNIVDHKEEVVPLNKSLSSIRLMVEMLVNTQNPLPSELENVDAVSYVYLTCLCDRKEIKSDEVHKATRGSIIEPDVLIKAGVLRKGRAKRGRTYEVKLPDERLKDLEKIFGKKDRYAGGQAFLFPELEQEWFDNVSLVDVVHYLMAMAITGENIAPWLRIFKPVIVPVRVALEYMMQKNPTFQEPIQKVLNLIEV
jgi:adenine-specific DNA methylase